MTHVDVEHLCRLSTDTAPSLVVDAYAAAWMRRADLRGPLESFLSPGLTESQRAMFDKDSPPADVIPAKVSYDSIVTTFE